MDLNDLLPAAVLGVVGAELVLAGHEGEIARRDDVHVARVTFGQGVLRMLDDHFKRNSVPVWRDEFLNEPPRGTC